MKKNGMNNRNCTAILALVAWLFAASGAWGQGWLGGGDYFDTVSEVGGALFDTFATEEMKENYEIASGDQLREMTQSCLTAFASESLAEVAALRDWAMEYVRNEQASGRTSVLGEWLQIHMPDFTVSTVLAQQAKHREAARKSGGTGQGTGAALPHSPGAATSAGKTAPTAGGTGGTAASAASETATELAMAIRLYKQQYGGKSLSARAQQWSPQVREVFRKAGMPEELIWQAEVESSWNPAARSPVGAAGLFQFMKPTAAEMGLRTENPDDRLDALLNAAAATRYLRQLYGRFGDWALALAAYNCGGGRVNKLRRESGKGDAAKFEDIYAKLPAETKLYVPKIDALIQLREGKTLADVPGPQK